MGCTSSKPDTGNEGKAPEVPIAGKSPEIGYQKKTESSLPTSSAPIASAIDNNETAVVASDAIVQTEYANSQNHVSSVNSTNSDSLQLDTAAVPTLSKSISAEVIAKITEARDEAVSTHVPQPMPDLPPKQEMEEAKDILEEDSQKPRPRSTSAEVIAKFTEARDEAVSTHVPQPMPDLPPKQEMEEAKDQLELESGKMNIAPLDIQNDASDESANDTLPELPSITAQSPKRVPGESMLKMTRKPSVRTIYHDDQEIPQTPYLLHVDVSSMGANSKSKALAIMYLNAYKAANPKNIIVSRDLAVMPEEHLDETSIHAGYFPIEDQTEEMKAKHLHRKHLVAELANADGVLISTPMYNWSTPSVLKAYVDQIILPGSQQLAGKPVTFIVACGGSYSAGSPHPDYDYLSGHLKLVAANLGATDIHIIRTEYTLAGVMPGMEQYLSAKEKSYAEAAKAIIDRAVVLYGDKAVNAVDESTPVIDSPSNAATSQESNPASAAPASRLPAAFAPKRKCGYVAKQGQFVKSWKKRYFVLDEGHLKYYESPSDNPPYGVGQKGHVHLNGMVLKVTGSQVLLEGGSSTFDRSLLMEIKDSNDRNDWIAAIQEHIDFYTG